MRIVYRARGTSMVEVVITLLLIVTAAGGLVRASMHVRSTASQATVQQAAWRLASELAEWLRLRGDHPLGTLPEDPASLLVTPAGAGDCYRRACAAAEAARFFLHDWYRRLRARLPGFRLMVCHGSPAQMPTPDSNDASCVNQVHTEGIVWFRLWRPQANADMKVLRTIELSVRRAP